MKGAGRIKRLFPIFEWLPNYNKKDLVGDFSAGLTIAVMLILQGMAYDVGWITSRSRFICLHYSFDSICLIWHFRHLGVGPIAIISLLVFSGVSTLAEPGTGEYISLVILLTFMVGILQFAMGALNWGL